MLMLMVSFLIWNRSGLVISYGIRHTVHGGFQENSSLQFRETHASMLLCATKCLQQPNCSLFTVQSQNSHIQDKQTFLLSGKDVGDEDLGHKMKKGYFGRPQSGNLTNGIKHHTLFSEIYMTATCHLFQDISSRSLTKKHLGDKGTATSSAKLPICGCDFPNGMTLTIKHTVMIFKRRTRNILVSSVHLLADYDHRADMIYTGLNVTGEMNYCKVIGSRCSIFCIQRNHLVHICFDGQGQREFTFVVTDFTFDKVSANMFAFVRDKHARLNLVKMDLATGSAKTLANINKAASELVFDAKNNIFYFMRIQDGKVIISWAFYDSHDIESFNVTKTSQMFKPNRWTIYVDTSGNLYWRYYCHIYCLNREEGEIRKYVRFGDPEEVTTRLLSRNDSMLILYQKGQHFYIETDNVKRGKRVHVGGIFQAHFME